MPRHRLIARLQYLRDWEALNVVLVPALLAVIWYSTNTSVRLWAHLLPTAVVSLILAQGTWYWHLKLREARDRQVLPAHFCVTFTRMHALAVSALLVLVATGLAARPGPESRASEIAWWAGLSALAALEYVNYYHWQLMHDSAHDLRHLRRYRRLRPSPLATDRARCRKVGVG